MTNVTYEVGEVAIIAAMSDNPEFAGGQYVGTECTITAPLGRYPTFTGTGHGYCATLCDGRPVVIRPQRLRKKKPPTQRTELGSWDACPFKPVDVRV